MCAVLRMINARKFHGMSAGTVQRIFAKGDFKSISPFKQCSADFPNGFRNPPDKIRIGGRPFCIKTIVTEHIKILFRDMDDQFFDEFTGAFCNSNFFIILMTLIPVGHISTVIGSDAGLSHNRSSNVTDDIINNSLSRAKLSRRSIDIETVIFGFVESVCERFEIRKRKRLGIKSRFHIKKQSSHKSTSEHGVWEKAYILPFFITVQSTFGDDHMYMGVPFKIASKCMKPTNHTGFEVSGMILFIEPI